MKRVFMAIVMVVAVAGLCAPASAEPIINIGTVNLQPNLAAQAWQVLVTGGDLVQGMNFYVRVGDGIDPGNAPRITGVDILGTDALPTIFHSNNNGVEDYSGTDLYWGGRSTTTQSGRVAATGRVAIVTFDTTGVTSGTWALSLMDPGDMPSDFGLISMTADPGYLHVLGSGGSEVPEPSTLALLASFAAAATVWYWRRR